jgi:hypothetical protein
MARIVEADRWNLSLHCDGLHRAEQVVRMNRPALVGRKYEIEVLPGRSGGESFFELDAAIAMYDAPTRPSVRWQSSMSCQLPGVIAAESPTLGSRIVRVAAPRSS